jgi:tRNA(Arg) A34 adenosine deaminase TadA
MKLAIKKAREGIETGQEPFGACIVKNGEVVVISHNTVKSTIDVSAHAEMNAIREACKMLNSIDLSGCDIYATYKPCPMCQAACERANISRIFYGVGPEDTGASSCSFPIKIKGGVMKDECMDLLQHRSV